MSNQISEFNNLELDAMVKDVIKSVVRPRSKAELERLKKLTPEEILDKLGETEACRVNFIPMMFSALAAHEARKLLKYAADNKVQALKKHSRVIKDLMNDYDRTAAYAFGPRITIHKLYSGRFIEETMGNVWKMELQADTLAKNQQPENPHPMIPALTLIIKMLIEHCKEFDEKVDRLVAEKLDIPLPSRKDFYMEMLLALCTDIQDDDYYNLEPDDAMKMWVGIIFNQAWRLVEKIIEEEKSEMNEKTAG